MSRVAALELLRQAMAAARANDNTRTRELLQDAVRLDPDNETAWQWLANVAEAPLEATAALERVLILNPKNEKARAAIRPLRVKAGVDAAKGKDVPTARRLLRTAVADDPACEQGWFWLASVCESPYEALAHLRRVLELNPGNAAAKKGVEYYNTKIDRLNNSAGSLSGVMRPPTPPSSRITTAATTRPAAATPPPARKLLVIDPSRTVRKLVAMAALSDGGTVTEAADTQEAVERLREKGPPDLIFVASALPGIDGYEFCKVIRQSTDLKRVPVVMLTDRDGLVDKLRARAAGVDAVLPKPFDPDALFRAVRRGRQPDPTPAG